jgi:uncharacterized protein YeaO (DUF488 family)
VEIENCGRECRVRSHSLLNQQSEFLMIKVKRVYETPSPGDGARILVERLWPRGFSRDRAAVDLWLKEVAPSAELRRWFGHDPTKWQEFEKRYRAELRGKKDAVSVLCGGRRTPSACSKRKARRGPLPSSTRRGTRSTTVRWP